MTLGGSTTIAPAVLLAGLAILVALPAAGVTAAAVAELRARAWRFAAAALIVLALLCSTLATALR
jgi:hypothetical protein